MKLHTVCIFAVALTSTLLLDPTDAQNADCSTQEIQDWIVANLFGDFRCLTSLAAFNDTSPDPAMLATWMGQLDYVCTTDSCGGAFYRYLLTNCSSNQANGLQVRCATNERNRCFCAETVGTSTSPTAPLICFRNFVFGSLASCIGLNETTNCTDNCRQALQFLYGNLGCCVNTVYNSTSSPANGALNAFGVQNPDLWELCGVPTPGTCDNVLSDMAPSTTPTVMPSTTPTVMPTTAGSDATAASKTVIGLLLALAFIKTIF